MDRQMMEELIADTTREDIAEAYRPVVDLIGMERFIRLAEYVSGDQLYIPKIDNIVAPARNRRIRAEYDGFNVRQLAERYGLTTKQIANVLRDVQIPGQMSIDEWLKSM